MTTFYRTRITIEVLHEYPIPDEFDLADIIREGDLGSYVIDEARQCTQPITGAEMAQALRAARSSPDFFGLDDDGNPLQECA